MDWVEGWQTYFERDIEFVMRQFQQGDTQLIRRTPIFRIAHDRDLPELYRPKCEECGRTMYWDELENDWQCDWCNRYRFDIDGGAWGDDEDCDDDEEGWYEDDYFWEDHPDDYFPEEDDWDLQEEDILND